MLAAFAPPAAADAKLQVSPTIMELDAEAGASLVEFITVTAVDDALVVELVHADFGFSDSSYDVTLIRDDAPETTAFSTREWFSLPKAQYRIPAGTSKQLPLTIKVPKNTPAGTYLGAALIRVVPPASAPGASQVQAVPEAGPLLFVAVAGGDPPKPALKEFDVPGIVGKGPIRPKIVVENQGDAFFNYEGTIQLRGPGKDDTVEVSRQFVVPGQPRRLRTSADKRGDTGRPELGTKDLRFGRYEVRTRLRIEPTGKTLVSSRTVWVIPTWAWLVGTAILLVLLGAIGLLVRWFVERRRLAPFLAEEQTRLRREQAAAQSSADDDDEDELSFGEDSDQAESPDEAFEDDDLLDEDSIDGFDEDEDAEDGPFVR